MSNELNAYLETIEPELRVLTRLFGYPESVWDEPKKFVPVTDEQDGLFRIAFEADGHRAERTVPAPGEELQAFCLSEYKDLRDYMFEQETLEKDYDDLK